ncbi:acetyl-CoA carboxylase biotin carboxylase subunit [Mechercharimyces sp. CAU 1602]|uniref:acetyl-CoA carboxylase biotin carboxylase subunit n=1 Tax=Mechercharimyces sp. CAU 1602 TaxID=2973933 RepID=UPI002162226C|nr:acetyl-CoA carboxylase biotin carboxylase subunit [Mechercharimyces sp. CAU 1602]
MQKVLIANRGEIAARVIRTCKRLGIASVAIYSDADRELPYVYAADEAVHIGASQVKESYLNMEKVIEAAKRTGADAIHPGYGLLSENSLFAEEVEKAGIIFIGPRPEVIAQMGEKVLARRMMKAAGVPIIPGTEDVADVEQAVVAAAEIGYPIMVKASHGGGGVGMAVCHDENELRKHFSSVQTRSATYFGNGTLYLERYVQYPRHVEVQIMGDKEGNVMHLFERECSVQRRNQKVIEESLSPSIHDSTRERLYEAAVKAGKAVHYTGAGTVEFIVDKEENIYFLEMNTRLQVEHPVTEQVTGWDLVEWQLKIAEGEELPVHVPLRPQGHALEYRIYAENPETLFPSPGHISELKWPLGEGIRIDSGVEAGNDVSPFYDPMIAKCIVSGSTREEALARSMEALSSMEIKGIKTNIPLLIQVLKSNSFQAGQVDTQYLERMLAEARKK